MNNFKIIAFTHKLVEIEEIGNFHIDSEQWGARLNHLKSSLRLEELMYMSTCNRVEFVFVSNEVTSTEYLQKFFKAFNPDWNQETITWAINNCIIFEGIQAVRHLFATASSIDSLVIGEREIITQVRSAYEKSKDLGLTGDRIRLVVKHTVEAAKAVYTETDIAKNPVSVVSLAYRKLRDLDVSLDARILIIGAGETNDHLSKYICKHGFKNFSVFNRTLAKAEKLASFLGGKAFDLKNLADHKEGFDVIITCTGSSDPIITKHIYTELLQSCTSKKTIIDLAVPSDLENTILKDNPTHYIGVSTLNEIAKNNLKERAKDLHLCWEIIDRHIETYKETFKIRQVERAMSLVPQQVKDIRRRAIEEVFAKEINELDEDSKEKLDRIVSYLEKKYISLPMKMAREIIVDEVSRKK
jgi:glutamyl-tRNA reductase